MIRGDSGATYEVVGRRIDVDTDMKPAVYVVFFKVDTLDDVPRLSRMADDISKAVEAEADRVPVKKVAILATKGTRAGNLTYQQTYGFRFAKNLEGTWVALDSKS